MHAFGSSVHSHQNDKTREDTKDSKVQHTMGADTFCNVSYRYVFSTILHIFVRKGYVIFMFFSLVCSINYKWKTILVSFYSIWYSNLVNLIDLDTQRIVYNRVGKTGGSTMGLLIEKLQTKNNFTQIRGKPTYSTSRIEQVI